MSILPITNPTCIVRNTGTAHGRTLSIEPGKVAVKHLRYGRIVLDGASAPLDVDDDRLFWVVNVHPDFASGGSGIERGRTR